MMDLVKILQTENAKLSTRIAALEVERDALRAENARLREALEKVRAQIGWIRAQDNLRDALGCAYAAEGVIDAILNPAGREGE